MIVLLAILSTVWGAEIYRPHSSTDYALGLSSNPVLTLTSTSIAAAWFRGENQVLITHLGIATDQNRFGIAGQYEWTVSGGPELGLHLGAGIGIGTNTGFTLTLAGLSGIHIKPGGLDRIWISVDAALGLAARNGALDFTLIPVSPALGLSVFYRI